eukprot:GHVS01103465.1.p1 GENE.GHVS01103465.1~~GHVS01103465.1.p1  ORF type:complete len:213 (+),score=17.80 GHVS01103465.1:157-795(+)
MTARLVLTVPVFVSCLFLFTVCQPPFGPLEVGPPVGGVPLSGRRFDDAALIQAGFPSYDQAQYNADPYQAQYNADPYQAQYNADPYHLQRDVRYGGPGASLYNPGVGPRMSRYRCCSNCRRGDIECFMTCERSCLPERGCDRAGRNVYAVTCERICGRTLRATERLVPVPACRGMCAAQAQMMCQRYACREFGCPLGMAGVRCLREAPLLCG